MKLGGLARVNMKKLLYAFAGAIVFLAAIQWWQGTITTPAYAIAIAIAIFVYFYDSGRDASEEGRRDPLEAYAEGQRTPFGVKLRMPQTEDLDFAVCDIYTNQSSELAVRTPIPGSNQERWVFLDGRIRTPHENRIFANVVGSFRRGDFRKYTATTKSAPLENAFQTIQQQLGLKKEQLFGQKIEQKKEEEEEKND
jgi:hypothetical protein